MADRLIFAPPDVLRQMIEDLHTIAGIPRETLQQISQQIAERPGFFQDADLAALLTESLESEEERSAVFNTLQNVRPEALDQVLDTVDRWRRANERNRDRFSEELLLQLREKLPVLIQRFPALDRMRKAERLRSALGNELKGAIFICDARPVYNEERDEIEGLMPLVTLKVVYEQQNQSTEEIEFILSSEHLHSLLDQAQKAQQKLAVLRERINDWLPDGCVDDEEEEE